MGRLIQYVGDHWCWCTSLYGPLLPHCTYIHSECRQYIVLWCNSPESLVLTDNTAFGPPPNLLTALTFTVYWTASSKPLTVRLVDIPSNVLLYGNTSSTDCTVVMYFSTGPLVVAGSDHVTVKLLRLTLSAFNFFGSVGKQFRSVNQDSRHPNTSVRLQ